MYVTVANWTRRHLSQMPNRPLANSISFIMNTFEHVWVGERPCAMRSKLNKSGGPTRGGVRGPVQGPPNPWTDRQVDMSIWCYIYLIFLPCWATCPTASCISCAINPMIPKITNPAKNEVPQLPIDTTSASLKMTKENNSKFLVPHHLIGPWQFCTLSGPCYCFGGVPYSGYRLVCPQKI